MVGSDANHQHNNLNRHFDPPEAERSLNIKPRIIKEDFSARGLGRNDVRSIIGYCDSPS